MEMNPGLLVRLSIDRVWPARRWVTVVPLWYLSKLMQDDRRVMVLLVPFRAMGFSFTVDDLSGGTMFPTSDSADVVKWL